MYLSVLLTEEQNPLYLTPEAGVGWEMHQSFPSSPDCLWFSQERLEHACNSAELARGYQAETFACVCYKTAFKQWKCCLVMRNAIGRLIPLFKEELLKVAAGKGPPVPQLCSPASSSS